MFGKSKIGSHEKMSQQRWNCIGLDNGSVARCTHTTHRKPFKTFGIPINGIQKAAANFGNRAKHVEVRHRLTWSASDEHRNGLTQKINGTHPRSNIITIYCLFIWHGIYVSTENVPDCNQLIFVFMKFGLSQDSEQQLDKIGICRSVHVLVNGVRFMLSFWFCQNTEYARNMALGPVEVHSKNQTKFEGNVHYSTLFDDE